ncbi:MAG: endonuclease/exonuclease/phosphatase family protein [Clostridia bacterium]|nr:endonuclease/exonuclease/phosphatase family protein [Clostridia bacterium]
MEAFYISLVRKFMALMLSFFALLGAHRDMETPAAEPLAEGADVRVVQFNLRCTGLGKTSVAYRAPLMTAMLQSLRADSMGFQEANLRWMTYLEEHLTDYAYVGAARDDGKVRGEFSPIFYLKEKYDPVESGTFWLSKTPDKPGTKDWGSACNRICTWAVLENKETGARYAHFNTHLDHISGEARTHQMEVLLEKVKEYLGVYPVVLTGDLNDLEDSDMYREAVALLTDARRAAPVTDTQDTFHNYGGVVPKGLLDYVFVSENVTPLVFHVIDDKLDGAYLSDHYGVYVDLAMPSRGA